MFRSKIVFVLGAGASEEVGLPVGTSLKKKIARKLNIMIDRFGNQLDSGDQKILQALSQHILLPGRVRGDLESYLKVGRQLSGALPQAISIDNLLDAHWGSEQAEVCGKLGIVSSILEAERESKIYYDIHQQQKINFEKIGETWFVGFMRILTENVSVEEAGGVFENVDILSFNYDRCIEHYLHEGLQTYYGLNERKAALLMQSVKVIHPYGSVGRLPWQVPSYPLAVSFGSKNYNLLDVSKQIKTFGERVHEVEELGRIREIIQQAEIIVFLGFAFHRQNLELITPAKACKAKRIYATAYGISKSDCNVIQNELESMLKQKQKKAIIEFRNDLRCADLFNEYWRSLTAG